MCSIQYINIYTYNVSNILSARAQAQTHAHAHAHTHTHTPNTNDLRQNSYYWPTARPINLQQRRRRFYMSSFRTPPPPPTIVSCDGGFRERRVNELWRGRGRGKRTTTLSRIHFIIITRDGKEVKKKKNTNVSEWFISKFFFCPRREICYARNIIILYNFRR